MTQDSDRPVSFADIRAASDRLGSQIVHTPVLTSAELDAEVGAEVFLKAEIFQTGGSYKARGALNAVSQLDSEQVERGVVAHSSGNHGIALAWAASLAGAACTIVVPEHTNALKLQALDAYGANVVMCPIDGREAAAHAEQERTGAVFIHPYEHPDVIAGHGTTALELMNQVPDLDMIVAPIGGGSLLSSTAIVTAELSPRIRCIGAEPLAVDDSHRSLLTGVRQPAVVNPRSIADAVLGGIGERSFETLTRLGAEVQTVTEAQISDAAHYFIERLKLVVEPSAATGLALLRLLDVSGKRVALVVSGGNTDLSWLR